MRIFQKKLLERPDFRLIDEFRTIFRSDSSAERPRLQHSVSTQGPAIEQEVSSGFLGSYGITSVTAGDAWSLLAAEADRCVTELRARQIAIGASARMLCATTLHVAASAAAVGTSGGR